MKYFVILLIMVAGCLGIAVICGATEQKRPYGIYTVEPKRDLIKIEFVDHFSNDAREPAIYEVTDLRTGKRCYLMYDSYQPQVAAFTGWLP